MSASSGPGASVQPPVKTAYIPAYKPHRTLVLLLTAGFSLLVLMEVLCGAEIIYFMRDQGGFMVRAEAGELGATILALMIRILDLGYRGVKLLTIAMFLLWVHEANGNARALGAEGMSYTQGWSVGWFFIPVASLFMPGSVITEIYRASDPSSAGEAWKKTLVPPAYRYWWYLWVINTLLPPLALFWDSEAADVANKIRLASVPVGLLAAGLGILLVRGVHAMQEKKQALRQSESRGSDPGGSDPWGSDPGT